MTDELFAIGAASRNEYSNLDHDERKSVFFSTHILDVAEKLCDRVAIIKNGKIIKIGKMEEIKGDESLEQVFLELEEE